MGSGGCILTNPGFHNNLNFVMVIHSVDRMPLRSARQIRVNSNYLAQVIGDYQKNVYFDNIRYIRIGDGRSKGIYS